MNTKKLASILAKIHNLKSDLEALTESAQGKYDDMNERVQEGERGDALQEIISNMEEAANGLDTAIDALESIEGVQT